MPHDDLTAGFSRVEITPPLSTPLMGWGHASTRLATRVNDPLYVRALWLAQGTEIAVILTFDLCFISRLEAQRWHGMLARSHGLQPHQVLFAATHTHAGPATGTYLELIEQPVLRDYHEELDRAIVTAIDAARHEAVPVTMRCGSTQSSLPLNRRRVGPTGITNAPNPHGPVYGDVPLMLLESSDHRPVCLMFGLSTHPVTFGLPEVSADYPGVATDLLDQHLGRACSLFLQGAGGDSRPRTLMEGDHWIRKPTFVQTQATGKQLAEEVVAGLASLAPISARLRSALIESHWPLIPCTRQQLSTALASDRPDKRAWAKRQLVQRERNIFCRDYAPILVHKIEFGPLARLIGIEGEPVHTFGHLTKQVYPDGATMFAGYCHGEGLYLVSTPMLSEGGYEPESFWEYNQPGPLAPETENVFVRSLMRIKPM